MVSEFYAGLSSLKIAFDLAKGLKDIDDTRRLNAAIVELQEKILSAQTFQFQLIETIGELKKRVADFEAWSTEAERYELKEISDGAFAYVVKEAMQGAEPTHAICPACYQKREKSILQAGLNSYGWGEASCPACKLQFAFNPDDERLPFRLRRK